MLAHGIGSELSTLNFAVGMIFLASIWMFVLSSYWLRKNPKRALAWSLLLAFPLAFLVLEMQSWDLETSHTITDTYVAFAMIAANILLLNFALMAIKKRSKKTMGV